MATRQPELAVTVAEIKDVFGYGPAVRHTLCGLSPDMAGWIAKQLDARSKMST